VRRLLIVDDDEAIRKLFRLNLSGDYEIIDTADPEEALALAMEHKPDAILLDMRMPKFTGLDLCRTFNNFSQTNLVPILVISGALSDSTKEACAALGATGFFSKPIDFDALKSRLTTVKRRAMVPRSEVRIRLKVPLKLRGTDSSGHEFEASTITENVSLSGFYCGCVKQLLNDAVVEVYMEQNGKLLAGRARCVRTDSREGEPAQYAFRFIEKTGNWILK
jgi:DNA-binding response OmpR family regulator